MLHAESARVIPAGDWSGWNRAVHSGGEAVMVQAEWLGPSDVAALTGLSPVHLRRLALAGDLRERTRTAGGWRLYLRSDVEAFMAKRRGRPGNGRRSRVTR